MSLDFNPTYTDITHSMLAFYWIIPVEVGPEYVPCLFLKHCVLFCVGGYIHEGDFERPADELDKSPVEGSRVQVKCPVTVISCTYFCLICLYYYILTKFMDDVFLTNYVSVLSYDVHVFF